LKALEPLLRARSVTEAAKALGIWQPAMSHALAQLRHGLNDRLLVRRGAAMTLTSRAAALIDPAADILARIHASVLQPPEFSPASAQRVFRLGLSDHLQTRLLPALIARVRQAAPGLRLVTRPTDRDSLGAALHGGALDLAIAGFSALPTERFLVLRQERVVALFDPLACGWAAPLSIDDCSRCRIC
jgi:DNA-binding transcriptional LysR family regulator